MDRERHCLVCPRCGREEPLESGVFYAKTGSNTEKIVVIGEKEKNIRTLPQTSVQCPKCGNRTAYWWMVQTRRADESPTQFYRCTKCNNTWREYS